MPGQWNSDFPRAKTAVLAVSGTKSAAANLSGGVGICGLYTDANLTGTAVSFEVSYDGTTYVVLKDGAGATYSKTVAPSNYIALDPSMFAGVRFIKVVSNASQLTNASTFRFAVRPL